jgi:hypothetical protein
MPEIEDRRIVGFACDATDCTAELRPDLPTSDWFAAFDYLEKFAAEQGWSIWVGRSRRYYCRVHAPRPGHSMRLVRGPVSAS